MSGRVSVLLCTRNRPEKARRCIASILANSYRDFELIVVDQSTDDRTRDAVDGIDDSRLVYIRTTTVGLSRSRNIAVRASRTETILFTDDDCICDADWIGAVVAEYDRDPLLMGVFGRVVAYGTGAPGMFCPCLIERDERQVVDRPVTPYDVLGAGNNMSFRKEVFRRIGLFIETLGAGTWMKSGEDTEFVYRALHNRMRFAYAPGPLVEHDNWLSRAQYPALARGYILGATAVLTAFALRGVRSARRDLARNTRNVLTNKLGAGGVAPALGPLTLGCLMGVRYLLASPPRLQELVQVRPQRLSRDVAAAPLRDLVGDGRG
ncbi:glycosyltransferase family 2 protein [Vineibacter terrae]|nr:glycosyltransferase family A protein [Vineibacter terrae]